MAQDTKTLALALAGGGARAAYQVGLLRHLGHRFPNLEPEVLTGVSAGAINAAYLASCVERFGPAALKLEALWRSIALESVVRTDLPHLAAGFFRWAARLATGGSKLFPPARGMFDTAPLRRLLESAIRHDGGRICGIQERLSSGRLRAVGVTTTCYATGRSVTWVQGHNVEPWSRSQRLGVICNLGLDHVMASAALPLLFPAIKVGQSWHGDGGIRLTAPLSPAMHLGAERILAISTRYRPDDSSPLRPSADHYPSPAKVIGVLLNAVFLDMLDFDTLSMGRINQLLDGLPEEKREGMRKVEVLVIRPSQDLGDMAGEYEPLLPARLRFFTRGFGADEARSSDSLSMLMFVPDYLHRLIELGEKDAIDRADEIEAFLRPTMRGESD